MNIKKTFIYLFGFIATAMFIILFFIIMLVKNRVNLQVSQVKYFQSSNLADDLRLTYHNFTKYARNFVFTGDTLWENKYLDLLESYKKNATNDSISYIGKWQDKLSELGLTQYEFELLNKSRKLSHHFVTNELTAINAYKGIFTNTSTKQQYQTTPNKEMAKSLLFKPTYRQQKQEALLIIDEIEALLSERTNKSVRQFARNGKLILLFLAIFITLVIIISLIAYRLIVRQLKLQLQDINERKQAEQALILKEQQLQYAFAASNEGLWDYKVKENTFYCSPRTYDLLNVDQSKVMNSDEWLRLLTADKDLKINSSIVDVITKHGVYDTILTPLKQAKDKKWIHVIGQVVELDRENKPLRIVGTLTDITDRMKEEERIINAVLETEDRERSRIASDIHDGLQQTMTTSILSLEKVKTSVKFDNEEANEKFDLAYNFLKKAIGESRTMAHNLMPKIIDKEGLVVATENLIEAFKNSTEIEFVFHENLGCERFRLATEITFFRIIQESINNIIKHAKATKCQVQILKHHNLLSLAIEDNGSGFELSSATKSFGLNSMRTRAESIGAYFEVESQAEKGTHILVELPL